MTERPDPLAEPEGYGSRLGRLQHLTERNQIPPRPEPVDDQAWASFDDKPDTLCDWAMTSTGAGRCGLPRVQHWLAGCVNEHIAPIDVCARHARESLKALTLGRQKMECTLCHQPMIIQKRAQVAEDGSLQWLEHGRIEPAGPPEDLFA